ncbi:MAG: helix-turn-helix domain-containing protein [Desulfurococcales archaeon]|nr:helix-turn-helix domain-containing protein [Desulfurococcales archaeon]
MSGKWRERLRESLELVTEPPFTGSSLYMLNRALKGDRFQYVEPLSPYMHAVAVYRISPEEITVWLNIAPLPIENSPDTAGDWSDVIGRASKLLPRLMSVGSVEPLDDDLISYKVRLESPVRRKAETILLLSTIRGLSGVDPVGSLREAQGLLSIEESSIPRRSMIYEALLGMLTLTLIEVEGQEGCPPGSFTLENMTEALGIPKATAYRLLTDMERLKLVEHRREGPCKGYVPNLNYEPLLGDLMLAASQTSKETVETILYLATGKRWERLTMRLELQ